MVTFVFWSIWKSLMVLCVYFGWLLEKFKKGKTRHCGIIFPAFPLEANKILAFNFDRFLCDRDTYTHLCGMLSTSHWQDTHHSLLRFMSLLKTQLMYSRTLMLFTEHKHGICTVCTWLELWIGQINVW